MEGRQLSPAPDPCHLPCLCPWPEVWASHSCLFGPHHSFLGPGKQGPWEDAGYPCPPPPRRPLTWAIFVLFQKRTTCLSLRPQPWIPPTSRKLSRTSSQVGTGPGWGHGNPSMPTVGGPGKGTSPAPPPLPGLLQSPAPELLFLKPASRFGHEHTHGVLRGIRPDPEDIETPSTQLLRGPLPWPHLRTASSVSRGGIGPLGVYSEKEGPLILQEKRPGWGYLCDQTQIPALLSTQPAFGDRVGASRSPAPALVPPDVMGGGAPGARGGRVIERGLGLCPGGAPLRA